uniref:Uncharacterized protein n=1 Tax=virus sp. ctDJ83 TaxID=2827625 RepID=A0A8S5RJL0_9VIRU|nr:MAG TPA: hypothetical protein [virus sp. ctDJ83]
MRKRHKQEKIPSVRDAARSFIEAIIAQGKAFEVIEQVIKLMKQEERNRTDE